MTKLDELIKLVLIWDVPALRKRRAADNLLSVMNFSPRFFGALEEPTLSDSPLDQMALGLKNELQGETEAALDVYRHLALKEGLTGLLGHLLLAWESNSSEPDLQRIAQKLEDFELSDDLRARIYLKLMTWSRVRGWTESASRFYERAHTCSENQLKAAVAGQSRWFTEQQTIVLKPLTARLVVYPWIGERQARAVSVAFENRVKNSARRRTTTWSIGGTTDGADILAAELQADWTGAHWLLPDIWRSHAALILERSDDLSADASRAIGLWALGGGEIGGLVEAYEGHFSDGSADSILRDQLKSGAAARDQARWVEACSALWDEMSADLAESLVNELPLRSEWFEASYSNADETVALFAILADRCQDPWTSRYLGLSLELQSLVIKSMAPAVALDLSPEAQNAGMRAFIATHDRSTSEWARRGWATLAALASRNNDHEAIDFLRERLDAWQVPAISSKYPDLLSRAQLDDALARAKQSLEQAIEEMRRGAYSFGSVDPSIAAIRSMAAIGEVDDPTIALIEQIANSRATHPRQSITAVQAINIGFDAGLVSPRTARTIANHRREAIGSRFWDSPDEAKLDDIERGILVSKLDGRPAPLLIDGARDTSPSVRIRALRGILTIAGDGSTSLSDTCILGALYDPDSRCQALGVEGILRQLIRDESLQAHGERRVRQIWPQASRDVRAAIAYGLAKFGTSNSALLELKLASRIDRSAIVRSAARA